jgi:hypothetical protein
MVRIPLERSFFYPFLKFSGGLGEVFPPYKPAQGGNFSQKDF